MDEEADFLEGLSFDLPDGTVIITAAEGAFGGLEQLEEVQARLNQVRLRSNTDLNDNAGCIFLILGTGFVSLILDKFLKD